MINDQPPAARAARRHRRRAAAAGLHLRHPALATEARVALTLRMVGGLTVAEIARAFLVQETTMAQRITRAKAKIKAAGIPYRVPEADDLPARVAGVLAVLYLVFNEGYLATGADSRPGPRRPHRRGRSGSPGWCASCCPTTARWPGCSR